MKPCDFIFFDLNWYYFIFTSGTTEVDELNWRVKRGLFRGSTSVNCPIIKLRRPGSQFGVQKTRSQLNSTGKLETHPHVSVTFDSRSSRLIDIYGNGFCRKVEHMWGDLQATTLNFIAGTAH